MSKLHDMKTGKSDIELIEETPLYKSLKAESDSQMSHLHECLKCPWWTADHVDGRFCLAPRGSKCPAGAVE